MKHLDISKLLELLVKQTGKPHMFITGWALWDEPFTFEDIAKALPYVEHKEIVNVTHESFAFLQFDSNEEVESAFRQTHCDCVTFPVFAQSLDTNFEIDENT